jgi:hypothetical protein
MEPEDLEICDRLERDAPPILRQLVEAWQQSGPNLVVFQRHWPDVWENLQHYLEKTPPQLAWGESGGCGFKHTFSDRLGRNPHWEAYRLFSMLITNPQWDKLAGPCARCGNYYIRRTARNSTYCSRFCGTRATATAATRRSRSKERVRKLKEAALLVNKWTPSKRTRYQDWKKWVTGQNPDLTVTFLTRAVNKGDLKPPGHN